MKYLYHVYCLLRKGEHRPFYIGATYDPHKREQCHWRRYGRSFTLVVLETLNTAEEASKLESELIIWYLERGVKLDNKTTRPCYYGLQPSDCAIRQKATALYWDTTPPFPTSGIWPKRI